MSKATDQSLLQALSDGALMAASNATIFKRGQAYAQSDAVQAVEQEDGPVPAARATVVGTQPYEVEVWVDECAVGGQCDCPNAEDGWFCKHQVALAMVWRGLLCGDVPARDETARTKVAAASGKAAKRARTLEDRREALAEFLRGQDAQVMAQRLLELADRDPAVERELQQWRKLSEAQRGAAGLTELKALATQILAPGRDLAGQPADRVQGKAQLRGGAAGRVTIRAQRPGPRGGEQDSPAVGNDFRKSGVPRFRSGVGTREVRLGSASRHSVRQPE